MTTPQLGLSSGSAQFLSSHCFGLLLQLLYEVQNNPKQTHVFVSLWKNRSDHCAYAKFSLGAN